MSNKIIFQFDDNLEYQKKAVKSVVELFRGLPKTIDSIYAEKIRKTRSYKEFIRLEIPKILKSNYIIFKITIFQLIAIW